MTIEIQDPEVERIVNEAILSGRYRSVGDVLSEAVFVWRSHQAQASPAGEEAGLPEDWQAKAAHASDAKNLVDLFAPLRGLFDDGELDFRRDPSPGRPVDLS